MIWQPHTRTPEHPSQTAIIAVECVELAPGDCDNRHFILSDIYRFDTRYGCWMTEVTGLKLKHKAFWWLPEDELLATLP